CQSVAVDGDYCRPHAVKVAAGETPALPSSSDPAAALAEAEAEPVEAELAEDDAPRSLGRTVSDLRAALTEDAVLHYDTVWRLIQDALAASKEVFTTCMKCHRRTPVLVPDLTARVAAARLLLEQTAGRPASNEAAGKIGEKAFWDEVKRRVEDLHGVPMY